MARAFVSRSFYVMTVMSLISLQGFVSFGGAQYLLGRLF